MANGRYAIWPILTLSLQGYTSQEIAAPMGRCGAPFLPALAAARTS